MEAELVDTGFVITHGELLLGAACTVFDVCIHNSRTVPRIRVPLKIARLEAKKACGVCKNGRPDRLPVFPTDLS